ncbi:TlpA family protein disulfide reductase [Flavobacterium agricola]|uniref:TlpA family protein disulfide reductase n=1 Tax=Flavobacterium agricola TaxID=2870839 RepID=A0ABY6M2Y0_9FLAO|nr:TlpA disulfide reductase family protein [Flavobacterium agricola]UYW02187.1 TlpA family protein disulfide reductase [Flavobacterium agricola]
MKKKFILLSFILLSAVTVAQTKFNETALNYKMELLDGKTQTFKKILNKYKGKTVLIDVWASWCPDCIKGLPKLKELQAQHPEVVYLFLDLDKTQDKWKAAIEKYDIKGEHIYAEGGMKSEFGQAIKLDWIPRYILINKKGDIEVFRAITADNENLETTLNKLK